MDVFEAIKNRRSIRVFQKKNVSEEKIETIIDAGSHAPSAGNIQPWEFVVVTDPEVKHQLAIAALNQSFVESASVVIVVCADEARSSQRYGSRGANLYCIQDTAAAVQNMLLAAHALGLGTCWVGAFREDMARKALSTPSHVRPVALVPIGYSAKSPSPRRRRPISEVFHRDTF